MKNKEELPAFNSFALQKSLFRHLSKEAFDQLGFENSCNVYKKGEILYKEGNRLTGVYCISSGVVKVFKTGSEGRDQIIKFTKAGDIIGYRSVLSDEPACTSTKVLEDAVLCFIPTETLNHIIATNVSFTKDLLLIACKELDEANSFITDIAQKSVRERLAEVLILLKNEFGIDNTNTLKIALTREELANIIGTATESVIRLLSEFKQDHLIDLEGRKIKLLNVQELTRIANLF
ncbi:MAG: Crp/Fnr family transcriptional regulator [Bacteroidetes bacterium RIFOXYA12_FULL_35_11]|nr:MAG: Crp/Fnr family transcriptional regulator [Bacteroidetes bacterium GWF2_35_48]OFY81669.1 MAG: Crp/Fnr family transcriptional regulator [Bacteroidetes bacterium RIFOXYA12_FULL_35_11]OFY96372.1 MAG: Crp/Fnr family transcriptional regulator [Bacteroidetes bacterium RIFOXYB2_FULL_35_7]HBX50243.1 Crp/Fnr family transcriptional regulator [Bacteroidales bacterium]